MPYNYVDVSLSPVVPVSGFFSWTFRTQNKQQRPNTENILLFSCCFEYNVVLYTHPQEMCTTIILAVLTTTIVSTYGLCDMYECLEKVYFWVD